MLYFFYGSLNSYLHILFVVAGFLSTTTGRISRSGQLLLIRVLRPANPSLLLSTEVFIFMHQSRVEWIIHKTLSLRP